MPPPLTGEAWRARAVQRLNINKTYGKLAQSANLPYVFYGIPALCGREAVIHIFSFSATSFAERQSAFASSASGDLTAMRTAELTALGLMCSS